MSRQREFMLLLKEADLTQVKLSKLLGVSDITVNRWTNPERPDAVEPPFYAVQFLRIYVMLPPDARRRIRERPKA